MDQLKFTRQCPACNITMFYKRKKDCNYYESLKKICKTCANKKRAKNGKYNSKEEFICTKCKNKFMEWRSQISNPDAPFCSKQCFYNSELKSLTGNRFGKLLVIERKRENNTTFYICNCDCGNQIITTHSNLLSDSCRSCGCLQKELLSKRSIKSLKEVIVNQIYTYYKRNAKVRLIEWYLTKDQVSELVFQPCFYCEIIGGTITKTNHGNRAMANNGIDRKDNTLPYTIENCLPCCKRCNQAKNDMSFYEFKEWATRLASKLSKW